MKPLSFISCGERALRVENTLKGKLALLALTSKEQKIIVEFDQKCLVDARVLR